MTDMPNSHIIDLAPALEMVGNDMQALKQTIPVVIQACRDDQQKVHQALAENDAATLEIAAHGIKGNARCFNAQRLMHITGQIENHAEKWQLAHAQATLNTMDTLLDQFIDALQQVLDQP